MPKISREFSDWFEIPNDTYNGRVKIRLPKSGEQEQIKERCRELSLAGGVPAVRLIGSRVALATAAIMDWENFFDADDNPLKCTPANVQIMCNEDGFLEFVDECMAELESRKEELEKAALKN